MKPNGFIDADLADKVGVTSPFITRLPGGTTVMLPRGSTITTTPEIRHPGGRELKKIHVGHRRR